jgi:hypothetical protein
MRSFQTTKTCPEQGQQVKVLALVIILPLSVDLSFVLARHVGQSGVIKAAIVDYGEELWLVEHDDGSLAVYSRAELAPAHLEHDQRSYLRLSSNSHADDG